MAAAENDQHSRRELKRARAIARDLERITQEVRKSLARHHSSVARFKSRVARSSCDRSEAAWKELCHEAESILGPTMQLAAHIAQAYDQIRQQSSQLMSFTEVRTDPLTGVSNRRAMDDALASMTAMKHRYEVIFLDRDRRHRPLQERERSAWPRGRRPGAAVGGQADGRHGPRNGHRHALRRRRVRRAHAANRIERRLRAGRAIRAAIERKLR